MLRFVSDGSVCGSRILNGETGEDITRLLRPSKVTATMGGDPVPTIAIELGATCKTNIAGATRWYIADPTTGDVRELSALEFADGSRVDLSAELFGRMNAGAA